MPQLIVLAGPNGAGKTTVSRYVLSPPRQPEDFVNADIIAANEGLDEIAAGRKMLLRLDELVSQRKDIAFETTLSSASLLRRIAEMQALGYVFHLVYVWIRSADMAVKRVAARVRAGGHSIPEAVIRRRYERSLDNFFNRYLSIADAWLMLDNSHRDLPTRIAERDIGGSVRTFDNRLWTELSTRYMKPPRKAQEAQVQRTGFAMQDIYDAARRSVAEALARHKTLGQSIVVWENGKVITLDPEAIEHQK
jgi:predicted ABC-type ATPase